MLTSMTGFSSKTAEITFDGGSFSLTVEIKALNARFFELTCRSPSGLAVLETDIAQSLKKTLRRGRVFVNLSATAYDEAFGDIRASHKMAQGYLQSLRDIAKQEGVPGEVTIADLAQFNDIFVSEKAPLNEQAKQAILSLVQETGQELMHTRREEGARLLEDLSGYFDACASGMAAIEQHAAELMVDYKGRVDATLPKAHEGDEVAKAKLEDLYASLNKIDVTEEITRFRSHLKSVQELLSSDALEKGKRFDFTIQELLRETNTTAAKCSSFAISSKAVDIKVALEKAREQVQNIL